MNECLVDSNTDYCSTHSFTFEFIYVLHLMKKTSSVTTQLLLFFFLFCSHKHTFGENMQFLRLTTGHADTVLFHEWFYWKKKQYLYEKTLDIHAYTDACSCAYTTRECLEWMRERERERRNRMFVSIESDFGRRAGEWATVHAMWRIIKKKHWIHREHVNESERRM